MTPTVTQLETGSLPQDLKSCHTFIRELLEALKEANSDRKHLQEKLAALLRKRFGASAEKLDDDHPFQLPSVGHNDTRSA